MADDIKALQIDLRAFAREREWEQFHTPKNLASALIVEAGELLEHFQWLTDEQSHTLTAEKRQDVAHELADVFVYLLQLSDRLDIDLATAVRAKMQLNAAKYPVERARGHMRKYTEL